MSGANDTSSKSPSPSPADTSVPPLLAAAFLIKFDLKVGYTITWKRSIPGIELDGAVEFKSLPSGLHTVKDDLVYFIHEQYAGLSAFVNRPASESERNAHFVAVGVLVPLSYGRLGRSWLHAQKLQELALALVDDTTKTESLERFWEEYRQDTSDEERAGNGASSQRPSPSVNSSGKSHGRARALSTLVNVLPSDQVLPSFHPALSILEYLETFGPLIFPLHRAALLRRRILFVTTPPVRLSCEYVFDLSILSSIPVSVAELLSPDTEPFHRLRPYFSIGIHDMPFLEKEATILKALSTEGAASEENEAIGGPIGWAACSTDEILAVKKNLYDVIIEMPAVTEHKASRRQWPKIKTNEGTELKATQRDLRRWKTLRRELYKVQNVTFPEYHDESDGDDYDDEDDRALLQRSGTPNSSLGTTANEEVDYDEKLIEPISWSQLAYNGFIWWASAGEQDASASEEADRDRQVLGDLSDFVPLSPRSSRHGGFDSSQSLSTADAGIHTAIIAYFHRLTSVIISTLAEVVDSADDEREPEDDADQEETDVKGVSVGSDEIARMGLDAWSEADGAFAREMLKMYFGREADVKGQGIECCGLRIC